MPASSAPPQRIAAGALRELRRVQPNISLAWIASHVPINLDTEREHYLEGFRRAGLGQLPD
jgi:hypothetical protein